MSLDFTRIILVFQSSCSPFHSIQMYFEAYNPLTWTQWIQEKRVYKSTIHTSLKGTDLSKNYYIKLVWKMVKAGENHDR